MGSKTINKENVSPVLDKLRDHLVGKNVAADIAAKLCDSVALKLEGKVKTRGPKGWWWLLAGAMYVVECGSMIRRIETWPLSSCRHGRRHQGGRGGGTDPPQTFQRLTLYL